MNWFRFYHEVVDDPKVQELSPDLFKAWVNLLCIGSQQDERGVLPELDKIRYRLRMTAHEALAMITALEAAGLIEDSGGVLSIHNWDGRQSYLKPSDAPEATRERKQRQRERDHAEKDMSRPVTRGHALELELEIEERRGEENLASLGRSANAPKPKRASQLPDDFSVNDEMTTWALAKNFTAAEIDEQTEIFKDHWASNKESKSDWVATWRNWMRRSRTFVRGSPSKHLDSTQPQIGPKGPNAAWFAAKAKAREEHERGGSREGDSSLTKMLRGADG